MRFASHRDIARAIERGVRKAGLPVAFSAGFSPHPKISYAGAAPTGTASEAEYLEIALTVACAALDFRDRLDAALPDGIDVIEVRDLADVPDGAGARRLEESHWRAVLPGVSPGEATRAVAAFLAADSIIVERLTNKGNRRLDARAAVTVLELDRRAALAADAQDASVDADAQDASVDADAQDASLFMIVQHVTPAVRPDDILAALGKIAALTPSSPPLVTRLAQGPLGMKAEFEGARDGAADRSGQRASQAAPPAGLHVEEPAGRPAAEPVLPAVAPALQAAQPAPRALNGAAAKGQKSEPRLAETGTAATDNAAALAVSASAYEQLPRGATRPDTGLRAREYDGRLPGCSRPSDTTRNQVTTMGQPRLATPLR
jgi:radical SAM-linked protein